MIFQSKILENIIGSKIDSFSYHRPPNWVLKNRKNLICGLINLYGDKYFEFDNCPKYIKYLADSKHKWSYGHPLENLKSFKKFHLNMHPDEWTIEGLDAFKNFKSLIDENKNIFINTLDSETMIFNKYMNNFI